MIRPSDEGSQGAPTSSGWTSDYVRDGFAVDGADPRTSTLPMEWRLRVQKLLYELVGAFLYRAVLWRAERRVVYPIQRLVGNVRNRENRVEQHIAETEYVWATVASTNRGIGSTYWTIGVAIIIGIFLIGGGAGWSIFFFTTYGIDGVSAALPGLLAMVGGITTLTMAYVALDQLPSLENETP